MIGFKAPELKREWPMIHPDTREVLQEFDAYAVVHGFPATVITDLIRDTSAQLRIYGDYFRRAAAILSPGSAHPGLIEEGGTWRQPTMKELDLAKELRGKTTEQLLEKAHQRFTWHWAWTAADMRTRDYSHAQLIKIKAWFEARCPRPDWEFLIHDVTAAHLHIARRDQAWRARHSPDVGPPRVV